MKKTKGMNLPDQDHVARHIPWARLRKDENDNILGILPQAFELRPQEPSLSVNWLEYFDGDQKTRLHETVKAIRASRNIGKKSAFGIGNVGKVKAICHEYDTRTRIVYAPGNNNPAHSEIRYLPRENLALFLAIAEDAFIDMVLNADIAD